MFTCNTEIVIRPTSQVLLKSKWDELCKAPSGSSLPTVSVTCATPPLVARVWITPGTLPGHFYHFLCTPCIFPSPGLCWGYFLIEASLDICIPPSPRPVSNASPFGETSLVLLNGSHLSLLRANTAAQSAVHTGSFLYIVSDTYSSVTCVPSLSLRFFIRMLAVKLSASWAVARIELLMHAQRQTRRVQ